MTLFSYELTQIVQQLAKYEHKANFANVLAKTAYQQIVESEIEFSKNKQAIKKALMSILIDGQKISGKQLYKIAGGQDFSWFLYERCATFVVEHQLYESSLYQEPFEQPTDWASAIDYFTVTELKSLLKQHGLKATGSRDELIERVSSDIEYTQVENIVNDKLLEKSIKWNEKYITKKYEHLARFLLHRFYFLRDITKQYNMQTSSPTRFQPTLLYVGQKEIEQKIACFLVQGGFDSVIVNQTVYKLLPLFPSSITSVNFKYS